MGKIFNISSTYQHIFISIVEVLIKILIWCLVALEWRKQMEMDDNKTNCLCFHFQTFENT